MIICSCGSHHTDASLITRFVCIPLKNIDNNDEDDHKEMISSPLNSLNDEKMSSFQHDASTNWVCIFGLNLPSKYNEHIYEWIKQECKWRAIYPLIDPITTFHLTPKGYSMINSLTENNMDWLQDLMFDDDLDYDLHKNVPLRGVSENTRLIDNAHQYSSFTTGRYRMHQTSLELKFLAIMLPITNQSDLGSIRSYFHDWYGHSLYRRKKTDSKKRRLL